MRITFDYIIANLLGHVVPVEMVAEVGKSDRVLKAKMLYSFQLSFDIQRKKWQCVYLRK